MEQPEPEVFFFRCTWQRTVAPFDTWVRLAPAYTQAQAEQMFQPADGDPYQLVAGTVEQITLDEFHLEFGKGLARAIGGRLIVPEP